MTEKLQELHSRSYLSKVIHHLKGQDDNKDSVYYAKKRSNYLKVASDHLKNSREASTPHAREFHSDQAKQALASAKFVNKKTRREKEYSGPKISLDDYEKKLKGHDWTYMYSDDNRVYKRGRDSESEIKSHAGQSKEHKALYDKYRLGEEKEMTELQESDRFYNVNFKTGDRVFRHGQKIGRTSYEYGDNSNIHEPEYGSVVKHTNTTAKVQWPDGSHTTHTHAGYKLGAPKSHDSEGRIHSRPYNYKSEEDHVNSIRNFAHEQKTNKELRDRHYSVIEDLKTHHHSHFTPEHLDTLEKINSEIKSRNSLKEETNPKQIDEVSMKTLKSYTKKAINSRDRNWDRIDREEDKMMSTDGNKYPEKQARHMKNAIQASNTWKNRRNGIELAAAKIKEKNGSYVKEDRISSIIKKLVSETRQRSDSYEFTHYGDEESEKSYKT